MNYKYDAFVSHSEYDNALVDRFCAMLTENEVTWYRNLIKKQGVFDVARSRAMESSKFCLFVFSYDFLFRLRDANSDGTQTYRVQDDIPEALRMARSSGMRVAAFVEAKPYEIASVSSLLNAAFIGEAERVLTFVGTLSTGGRRFVDTVLRERKIECLQQEADKLYEYHAYGQAQGSYIRLAELCDGDLRAFALSRADECAAKGKGEGDVPREKDALSADGTTVQLSRKIADYCDSSISLFEALIGDNISPDALNCLKTNYTRLLYYCRRIGGMDEFVLEAIHKMQELEEKAKRAFGSPSSTEEQVKRYRAYLGLDFPASEGYDVFVSYKSEDVSLARRVYDYLRSVGKKVFFDREELPDMGKTEFREAIMDALDHSQHFVLVTSSIAYVKTGWVSKEWGFFMDKLADGHHGNFALVLRDDCRFAKEDLPPDIRYKQRFLMSNFTEALLAYLQQ